jgi:hypothetical protein
MKKRTAILVILAGLLLVAVGSTTLPAAGDQDLVSRCIRTRCPARSVGGFAACRFAPLRV